MDSLSNSKPDRPGLLAVTLAGLSATDLAVAAALPEQLVEETLAGHAERLHPLIESHLETQFDWRSYYLNRIDKQRQRLSPQATRGEGG